MTLPEPTLQPASPRVLPTSAMLEAMPIAAYSCDAEGRIVGYNERAAALWGRRPKLNDVTERFCGSEVLLAVDGTPIAHHRSPTAAAISTSQPVAPCEAIVVRPDGSRRTVLVSATPLLDDHDRVIGATCAAVDISEREEQRRASQEALERSEAAFRSFFDSVAIGATEVDAQGRIVSVNDRYCEMTGYRRDELLRMSPFDLDHPDDRAADVSRVMKAVSDPSGVYHAEKRYLRKDGSVRWVHVAANMLRDEKGHPSRTMAIIMDISERKRAEEALQEADRLKDEFLATLAHELRNPLAPLASAAELLRGGNVDGIDWCRAVIDRQVTHLTRLIDDLLDVSRITRDKLELRKEPVDLAEVLGAAIEASRPMLERCEQRTTISLPEGPVPLHGDFVRLTQVFTNLLTNAAKFTEGPGCVRVTASVAAAKSVVTVADSGIGIARDELGRVFDKFYQSPGRGKRFLGGLGIGLSLVQRLVELHGGTVEARSDGVGLGSEFVVTLPLAAGHEALEAPARQPPLPASEPGRKRILIVDDNTDGADSLARLLAAMGHEAVTEYDGASALRRVPEFVPDVVFLDLGMPGLDGFEVCRRLHMQPSVRRPAIIALTGWGRKEDLARTKLTGFDAHLVKPVGREALARLLESEEPGSR